MGDAGPSLTGQQNAVALGHKVVLGGSGGRRTCLGEEPDGVRWSGMEEVCLVPDTGHLPGRDPGGCPPGLRGTGDGSTSSGLSTVTVHRYAAHISALIWNRTNLFTSGSGEMFTWEIYCKQSCPLLHLQPGQPPQREVDG